MLKTSLGLAGLVDDLADFCQLIGMESRPQNTSFQKASRKLLASAHAQPLLGETVRLALGRRKPVHHSAIDLEGPECVVKNGIALHVRQLNSAVHGLAPLGIVVESES